ncbi:MAG: hypothetical protein D3920_10880 [Candidatus Electrothrix sp. AW2]|nr:hypothetical protein [Candidatus Electrothrix sp. AX1]MCI5119473.1 hypothetical protein [Candidatus Electrothrix gigas]MCI5135553.1 hypothetical protein [Candidatus Electrothrix gigas]MCI5182169.1 hypothetical protein [Candidatus Electrothrix gigas]MCI5227012.1 hypothetical protein [Candidatus Electrothrix gigas]
MLIKRLNKEREFETYERLLYQVFSEKNPNNWLCKNYNKVNARYRAPFSYCSQNIFAVYDDNEIVAGVSLNFDYKKIMQLEQVGFDLRKEELADLYNYCEILNLVSKSNSLKVLLMLKAFSFNEMVAQNIAFAFTTSSKKTLPFYLRYGCRILKEKNVQCGTKYLLKIDFASELDTDVIVEYVR